VIRLPLNDEDWKWIWELNDYAELEQGLDPIGSSDILRDLTQWAMTLKEHPPVEMAFNIFWSTHKADYGL
jgi:hypothetical protein